MVVSDGLRSTFIWSKLRKFLRGACPQTLLERWALYSIYLWKIDSIYLPKVYTIYGYTFTKKKFRMLCAPHGHTNPTLCVPRLLQPLDPPLMGHSNCSIKTCVHVAIPLVSQAIPFSCSADHFQYMVCGTRRTNLRKRSECNSC